MPYRRLPTTDKARLRALNTANKIASQQKLDKLPMSQQILEELSLVKTNFENALKQYEADVTLQLKKNEAYKQAFGKTALYISHFMQVLFMTIERGELKADILAYYGMENLDGKLPGLKTEQELIEWGKQLINGEQKRIQHGGSPIYNPSIALVRVNVENFRETAIYQNNLKKNSIRAYEKVKQLRSTTNDFISRMWDEVEEKVNGDSPKHKRQLAQDYGVVYVFRRSEKKKLKSEDLQRDLLFEFV